MINAQVDDLSSHNTKYISPALTQKDVEDAAEDEDEDDDHEVSAKPTPSSPTLATPPPSPTQEHIPSPPQAQISQPSSPPPQQPLQSADISQSVMTILNTLLETCDTLTKHVANLEQDKIAQATKITKFKQRVRRRMHLNRGREIPKLDTDEDVTIEDVDAEVAIDANVSGRLAESQANVYQLDLEHAKKVTSMQDTNEVEPAEVQEVIEVVIDAKLMTEIVTTSATNITAAQVKASAPRRRRGIVIQDPEETATTSVIIHSELEARLNANINWGDVMEQVKRKKKDNTVMIYQALKRKPVTEARVRKNMMVYLKNMVGFKTDFFKGLTCNDIRPIFEMHYNSIRAFLEKGEKEIEKEGSKRKVNDDDDVFTEATRLASKVPIVDYQIHHEYNKPYYKIIRADGTHKLFLCFITLLKNFDREDLKAFQKLVKERFQSSEPKNFSDNFLLNTLKLMFEKPNVEANV
nr:hypothetical protein [Tanacetum cinerariifolium]